MRVFKTTGCFLLDWSLLDLYCYCFVVYFQPRLGMLFDSDAITANLTARFNLSNCADILLVCPPSVIMSCAVELCSLCCLSSWLYCFCLLSECYRQKMLVRDDVSNYNRHIPLFSIRTMAQPSSLSVMISKTRDTVKRAIRNNGIAEQWNNF